MAEESSINVGNNAEHSNKIRAPEVDEKREFDLEGKWYGPLVETIDEISSKYPDGLSYQDNPKDYDQVQESFQTLLRTFAERTDIETLLESEISGESNEFYSFFDSCVFLSNHLDELSNKEFYFGSSDWSGSDRNRVLSALENNESVTIDADPNYTKPFVDFDCPPELTTNNVNIDLQDLKKYKSLSSTYKGTRDMTRFWGFEDAAKSLLLYDVEDNWGLLAQHTPEIAIAFQKVYQDKKQECASHGFNTDSRDNIPNRDGELPFANFKKPEISGLEVKEGHELVITEEILVQRLKEAGLPPSILNKIGEIRLRDSDEFSHHESGDYDAEFVMYFRRVKILHVLFHEIAENLTLELDYAEMVDWEDAIEKDHQEYVKDGYDGDGIVGVSAYARSTQARGSTDHWKKEDWCDTFSMFIRDPMQLAKQYPNRFTYMLTYHSNRFDVRVRDQVKALRAGALNTKKPKKVEEHNNLAIEDYKDTKKVKMVAVGRMRSPDSDESDVEEIKDVDGYVIEIDYPLYVRN